MSFLKTNMFNTGLVAKWMAEPEGVAASPPEADRCRFVQLPQNAAGAGYYNYGTPGQGKGQYGLPETIDLIQRVGRAWAGAKFGVGNISMERGGIFPGHNSHKFGKSIDMRPMRRDGAQGSTNWKSANYDRVATQQLIDAIRASGAVRNILFNDPQIKGVVPWKGHDDHFHVNVRSSCPGR